MTPDGRLPKEPLKGSVINDADEGSKLKEISFFKKFFPLVPGFFSVKVPKNCLFIRKLTGLAQKNNDYRLVTCL